MRELFKNVANAAFDFGFCHCLNFGVVGKEATARYAVCALVVKLAVWQVAVDCGHAFGCLTFD